MKKRISYKWNIQNNTLYITKGFERQAGIYGTDEYNIFQNIKKDNPDMNVEYIKEYKTERSKENVHSLKVDFMEDKIRNSNNQKSIDELKSIKKYYAETKSYVGKVKKLYFDTYPKEATLATLKKKEKIKKEEAKKLEYIEKTTNNPTPDDNSTPDE